jgi:hypothetical protein
LPLGLDHLLIVDDDSFESLLVLVLAVSVLRRRHISLAHCLPTLHDHIVGLLNLLTLIEFKFCNFCCLLLSGRGLFNLDVVFDVYVF